MVGERTCELEERSIDINQKSAEGKDRGSRDSRRALWDTKQSNTQGIGIPGEESRRGEGMQGKRQAEKVPEEIITPRFSNLGTSKTNC